MRLVHVAHRRFVVLVMNFVFGRMQVCVSETSLSPKSHRHQTRHVKASACRRDCSYSQKIHPIG